MTVRLLADENFNGAIIRGLLRRNPEVDVVLFATPPGFRPQHVLEAVQAGKHVFAEKPSCVDPAGYRVCLAADELARENGTAIVTGTQYRRQESYVKAV